MQNPSQQNQNFNAGRHSRIQFTFLLRDPLLFGPLQVNLRPCPSRLGAVQILLGHRKIESIVRYLGIEVDDALAIAEQVDV
jgi:hypothetical protein